MQFIRLVWLLIASSKAFPSHVRRELRDISPCPAASSSSSSSNTFVSGSPLSSRADDFIDAEIVGGDNTKDRIGSDIERKGGHDRDFQSYAP